MNNGHMQFIFEQIRTGGDRNFAYLLGDRDANSVVGRVLAPADFLPFAVYPQ